MGRIQVGFTGCPEKGWIFPLQKWMSQKVLTSFHPKWCGGLVREMEPLYFREKLGW